MERLVQYLDDIEDLYCTITMAMERARSILQLCLLLTASFIIPFLGILLAHSQPPLALAAASIGIVGLLYRGATRDYQVQHIAT